jgi:glutathione S-transferase
MILIGQYDSPFVRRVAIALELAGVRFEHRPWSVWADAERLAAYNPLRRVPTLVLDDGTVLVDSTVILDAIDDLIAPSHAMLPRTGVTRMQGLRTCALATGAADKAVSLFYEGVLRTEPSVVWTERCRAQILETLDLLERERALIATPYWLGTSLSHADIAVACALRFIQEGLPGLVQSTRYPSLIQHASTCEALPAFKAIQQPLTVTLKN